MISWHANFQIPNSGVQSSYVYAVARFGGSKLVVDFFADVDQTQKLFEREYSGATTGQDVYTYLLSLDEFKNYNRV